MSKPLRTCTRCGQSDDHPRHVIAAVVGSGSAPANFHMDCHAALGCGVCNHQLQDADGVQGGELREHLQSLAPLTHEQAAQLLGQPAPGSEN